MGTKIAHSNIINNLAEIAVPTILTRPPVSAASASADNTDDEFTEIEIGNNPVKNDVDDKAVLPKQQLLGDVDPEQIPFPVASASLTAAAEENVNGDEEEEADFPPETPVDLGEKVGERERLLGVLFPNQDNLPKPQPPRGLFIIPSPDPYDADDVSKKHCSSPPSSPESLSALGRYIRQRSNKISNAIARRLSLTDKNDDAVVSVTEFNLSGLKVIVQDKSTAASAPPPLKGRVTFFSRSNSRDCGAVRSFLRERGLNYAEINVDVFPSREKELVDRTGGSTVPQIFFNEKLVGGLAELNALRKGALEQTLREMLGCKCPDDAPAPPVYGFDDDDVEEWTDEMSAIVRVLRQKLPIQDRLIRMRIVKNCFTGTELVDLLTRHFDCHRSQAVQIGRELMRKHFIHHVFGEGQGFGDSSNFLYRFIEHEQYITKCYNFRGSTNDSEPKPASAIGQRLAKIMFAILESYASEDRTHVDYMAISNGEEFRRYLNLVHGLQRLDLSKLSPNEKLAFFLNLYNAMVIHAMIRIGYPEGMMERKSFVNDFQYLIGGHPYSLSAIKNGILRGNRRPPYSLVKPFSAGDKRLQVAFPAANPLIHFGLCDGARSSPRVRFFTSQNVEAELKAATRELLSAGAVEVDLAKQTVHLTSIIKWFSTDFGSEREILKWLLNYLDANKAGLVTHLLGDWAAVNISYQSYDWSLNS